MLLPLKTSTPEKLSVWQSHCAKVRHSPYRRCMEPYSTNHIRRSSTVTTARSMPRRYSSVRLKISRSHPGCPWENGYQESFYDKFKVDLGDPGRFKSLGELVAEVYRTIWVYNNTRIHSALKMPPAGFEKAHKNQLSTLPLSV